MAYSLNHPLGMCPHCTGFGAQLELIEESLFDREKTLREGGILFSQFSAGWQSCLYQTNSLLDPDKKLRDFSTEEWEVLRQGPKEPLQIEIRSNNSGRVDRVDYEGVLPRFRRLYLNRDISKLKKGLQEEILSHVHKGPCKACGGTGLSPKALASKINGYNIVDYFDMPVCDLLPVLGEITESVGASIAKQVSAYLERMADVHKPLRTMMEVGLGYMSLGQPTSTLSGGEVQRVKLASELHKEGNIYILDEPTTGLHTRDIEQLLSLLRRLVAQHNTVVIIEHRLELIAQADWVIDMGPGGGSDGGQVLFCGTPDALMRCTGSKTGRYLK